MDLNSKLPNAGKVHMCIWRLYCCILYVVFHAFSLVWTTAHNSPRNAWAIAYFTPIFNRACISTQVLWWTKTCSGRFAATLCPPAHCKSNHASEYFSKPAPGTHGQLWFLCRFTGGGVWSRCKGCLCSSTPPCRVNNTDLQLPLPIPAWFISPPARSFLFSAWTELTNMINPVEDNRTSVHVWT